MGWLMVHIWTVIFAPIYLLIALLKLFFRAPLAAVLGAIFCGFVFWVGLQFFEAAVSGINPLAAVFFAFFLCSLGAGVAYGLTSQGWMETFFLWEVDVVFLALKHGGLLGRGFYIFVQIIPGISLVALSAIALSAGSLHPSDHILFLCFLGWLAVSQFVVYRFHRTTHPVGQFCTFTGSPRYDVIAAYNEMAAVLTD